MKDESKSKEKVSKESSGIVPNPELIKKRDKETVNRMLGAMEKSCETSK